MLPVLQKLQAKYAGHLLLRFVKNPSSFSSFFVYFFEYLSDSSFYISLIFPCHINSNKMCTFFSRNRLYIPFAHFQFCCCFLDGGGNDSL